MRVLVCEGECAVCVCGSEKEREREGGCVRVCVRKRKSVCERYRVCV